MIDISTEYLGLKLKNPIIASSSGLTSNIRSIRELEKAGVGAVVLKSVFEEQIDGQADYLNRAGDSMYDAADYINAYIRDNSLENQVDLIREAKRACSIPVIASINCYRKGDWADFARKMEEAGADALELNIFYMPQSKAETSAKLEEEYLATAVSVVEKVRIPVSVKMSGQFTNPLAMVDKLYFRGVKGVVMFNRLYEPDIDVETLGYTNAGVFSSSAELRASLRWIALSSTAVGEVDYAASTGIHTGEDLVKVLLAGANAAQVCSVLYQQGTDAVAGMLAYLESWMLRNGVERLEDAIGRMNAGNALGAKVFERSQFMKYFSNHE